VEGEADGSGSLCLFVEDGAGYALDTADLLGAAVPFGGVTECRLYLRQAAASERSGFYALQRLACVSDLRRLLLL